MISVPDTVEKRASATCFLPHFCIQLHKRSPSTLTILTAEKKLILFVEIDI